MRRKFTKYPQGYVRASQYFDSNRQKYEMVSPIAELKIDGIYGRGCTTYADVWDIRQISDSKCELSCTVEANNYEVYVTLTCDLIPILNEPYQYTPITVYSLHVDGVDARVPKNQVDPKQLYVDVIEDYYNESNLTNMNFEIHF